MDIYSQFRFLDKGQAFGHNFFSFRARFFEDKNRAMPASKYFPQWKPIKGADRKIKELIEPVSMYVEKTQCLSLPPLVKKVIEVPMGKEQQRLYESMKKDLVATITGSDGVDRHSIADLAIVKALRLMQILSGHIKVEGVNGEDDKTIHIKDNPRKDALYQLLEDIAPYEKCIVWAVFKSNYEDIREVCNKLKLKYVEINGEVKDKDEQAHQFRTDPDVRVLIGNPQSGGTGLNLVEASCMIYYSRTFSLEADLQSEARCWRGGSEIHQKITRIDLVCPESLDSLVVKCLASKQELSDKVLKQSLEEI
jgi:SNF2 family DNA or RNA helicase